MIVVTTEQIESRRITKTLGLITGLGEDGDYPHEQALQRMIRQAEERKANAIVGVRFANLVGPTGASYTLASGTAVEVVSWEIV